jgi:hypothetical protein
MKVSLNTVITATLLIVSFNSYAINQSEYESYIINKTIVANCTGYAHYQLPSGHQIDCIDKDTIWHYGFAKDYKNILNRVIDIEAITRQNSQIVFICARKKECDASADKINTFTQENNLVSVQMSAVVIPWL